MKNMNLFAKLAPALNSIQRYLLIIVMLAIGGIYGYLIMTAGQLAAKEPGANAVSDAYKATNSAEIDDAVIEKLSELQDQNVQFQALLEQARNNPFAE